MVYREITTHRGEYVLLLDADIVSYQVPVWLAVTTEKPVAGCPVGHVPNSSIMNYQLDVVSHNSCQSQGTP